MMKEGSLEEYKGIYHRVYRKRVVLLDEKHVVLERSGIVAKSKENKTTENKFTKSWKSLQVEIKL